MGFVFGAVSPTVGGPSGSVATLNIKDLGAYGDGQSHPLSSRYATLAAAQVDFPAATSLNNEIDGLVIDKYTRVINNTKVLIFFPKGTYFYNTDINVAGHQHWVGELSDGSYGTRITRRSNYAAIKAIGISSLTSGNNTLISRWDCEGIEFDGGWTQLSVEDTTDQTDCIVLKAAYELYWHDCHFTNQMGTMFSAMELWDSRFENCRMTWCGHPKAHKPAMNLLSSEVSPGYETCNNIVFSGWRFENMMGRCINIEGNNGVDIWLDNMKIETGLGFQLDYLVEVRGAVCVHMKHNWLYADSGTFNNFKFDVTAATTFGTGSKTFTVASGLTYNHPNWNLQQMRTGLWLVVRDKNVIENYMTGRVTSYNPVTGEVVINILHNFAAAGATATTLEIAAIHPGYLYVGGDTRVCTFSAMGGNSAADNCPVNGVYQLCFAHINNAYDIEVSYTAVNGVNRLPQNNFLAYKSTSSVTVGTGSKTFTIETGKSFAVGERVWINARTNNYMRYGMSGYVVSYDSGTGQLVVNVTEIGTVGTLADWVISKSPITGILQTGTNEKIRTEFHHTNYSAPFSTIQSNRVYSMPVVAKGARFLENIVRIPQADFNRLPTTSLSETTVYMVEDTGKLYCGKNLISRAYVPSPFTGINSLFPTNTIFEVDAGLADSVNYDGTVRNLITSPSDGSAKSAYDLFNGSSASYSATEDLSFNGVYDRAGSLFDGKTGGFLRMQSKTNWIKSLHKTSGGDFTFIFAGKISSSKASVHVFFYTGPAGGVNDQGIKLVREVDGKWYLFQRGDTATIGVIGASDMSSISGDVLIMVSVNRTTNQLRMYYNTTTATTHSCAFDASTVDAPDNCNFVKDFMAGGGVRTIAMLNKAISDAEALTINQLLSVRHGVQYTV